jgi:hypothetical protein
MSRVGWHSAAIDGADARFALAELLGRHLVVARLAQTPDVAVVVRAALRERLDMVGHDRRFNASALGTDTA